MQPTGDFSETNLNVITTSGEYFYFTLRYSNAPKEFSHIIKSESAFFRKGEADTVQPAKSLKSQFVAQSSDSESSNTIYEKILSESGFLQSRNSVRYKKMYLTIKGIYVSGDRLYFRIEVENKSNISYDVDLFSFVIKAKTESRNATQESTQQFWTEVHGNDKIIPSNTIQELIFEFDKFTIGKDKILNLELVEKSGERNLVLPIDNDWLIKAREVKL